MNGQPDASALTQPPPPRSKAAAPDRLFRVLATYSWLSLLLLILLIIGVMTLLPPAPFGKGVLPYVILWFFPATGLLAGIIALGAIYKYGWEGLHFPAFIGVSIWLLLIGGMVFVGHVDEQRHLAAQAHFESSRAPLVHTPGALRVEDAELGFSFELPPDYFPWPEDQKPPGAFLAYARKGQSGIEVLVTVETLKEITANRYVPMERSPTHRFPEDWKYQLPKDWDWRGERVDGFREMEPGHRENHVTLILQIPLEKQPIQIRVRGLSSGRDVGETELEDLLGQLLASLDGQVNL
jgi:hypothetical protein